MRRVLVLFVLLLVVPADADELPPLHKSLAELEQYDPGEDAEEGRKRLKVIGPAKESYKNPVNLDWACKLSADTIRVCEPISAEFTVTNPSDAVAVRFPQPARGFLSRNVQVWVRAEGEKQYTCPLGQRRESHGVAPVRVAPGETRRFSTRLDNYALASLRHLETGELQVEETYWLGDLTFRKPGQYEVVVRYLNRGASDGGDAAEQFDAREVRLFGPFKLTVTDRPKGDPEWVAEAREVWETVRPKCSDVRTGVATETFTRLSLKEFRSAGPAGDDIFLWTLSKQFGRLRAVKEEPLKPFLADLDEAVCKLPATHPNRAAAEFLGLAARLNRGEEATLRKAIRSTNPDVQLLAAEWLEKAEETRKKVK